VKAHYPSPDDGAEVKAARGDEWLRPQLCNDALRMGRVLTSIAPQESETHGLLALMELNGSRIAARTDPAGDPILLMEQNRAALMAMAVREAGKTIPDALAEVREAVDFCRYYAQRARADFAEPLALPGPTGERNQIALQGRGVFACISPWNFPLALSFPKLAPAQQ
jgi:RHH-type proline utilization regulon transcriptional repressor/proline dehydrogenase/delta 1-pyrroline-5-carboxylate dehydrogenase